VNDASAPPPSERPAPGGGWAQGLRDRTLSGLLMGVVAFAVLRQGDIAFATLVAAGAAVLAWEWARLCSGGRFGAIGIATGAVFLGAVALAFADRVDLALGICFAGATAVAILARTQRRAIGPAWAALGIFYLGPALVALIWLRGHGEDGERLVLWLLATVVVTDTGAFFAGRLIGGPRLAPRISPKKTWAGLGGAVAGTCLLGFAYRALDPGAPSGPVLALAGAAIACVAQMGDLAESWVKRHFGAKDSSQLIPGHGGLLDRVDGLVAAAIFLSVFQFATQGRWLDFSG
jgi:phosphatidate cytidylyltransferase